jgi:hypothetical protein
VTTLVTCSIDSDPAHPSCPIARLTWPGYEARTELTASLEAGYLHVSAVRHHAGRAYLTLCDPLPGRFEAALAQIAGEAAEIELDGGPAVTTWAVPVGGGAMDVVRVDGREAA